MVIEKEIETAKKLLKENKKQKWETQRERETTTRQSNSSEWNRNHATHFCLSHLLLLILVLFSLSLSFLPSSPSSALLALKRKKYQENLLDRTSSHLFNLDSLVHSLQFASVQSEVFLALSRGNETLKALNDETSVERVEELMQDSREAIEEQERIAALLGAELKEQDHADIEATMKKWEEEEEQEAIEKMTQTTNTKTIATTTTTEPTIAEVEEKTIENTASSSSSSSSKPIKATQKKEVVLS